MEVLVRSNVLQAGVGDRLAGRFRVWNRVQWGPMCTAGLMLPSAVLDTILSLAPFLVVPLAHIFGVEGHGPG
jgi:hypothetical protein